MRSLTVFASAAAALLLATTLSTVPASAALGGFYCASDEDWGHASLHFNTTNNHTQYEWDVPYWIYYAGEPRRSWSLDNHSWGTYYLFPNTTITDTFMLLTAVEAKYYEDINKINFLSTFIKGDNDTYARTYTNLTHYDSPDHCTWVYSHAFGG